MLEIAILKTQDFKNVWGTMPPGPPRKLMPSALIGTTPPPFLESPGSAPEG